MWARNGPEEHLKRLIEVPQSEIVLKRNAGLKGFGGRQVTHISVDSVPKQTIIRLVQAALNELIRAKELMESREVPLICEDKRLATVERIHIERIIKECGGDIVQAAKILGIGKTTIYRMRKRQEPQP
jgi:DNA-binding NtrC family response regulator